MKKLLAFAAVALVSTVGLAADKGTEFKFGGEIKEDFVVANNATFNTTAVNVGGWHQKNQFHVNAVSSDKLQAYFNFVHGTVWGASGYNASTNVFSTTGMATPSGSNAALSNSLEVAEAWMWWKVADNFAVRTGRQSATYGSGFVLSKNDDLPLPYFFDGLMARWSFDFMDADFGGAKIMDFGYTPGSAVFGNTDADILFYAVNFGFKSLPEVFKKLDVYLTSAQGDAGSGTAMAVVAPQALALPGITGAGSWNMMTYGLFTRLEGMGLDFEANVALQSGKQKTTVAAGSDTTFGGNAMDFRLGYSFPEFMKGRIFVGYHADSGQDRTSATGTTNNAYQPLFYDVATYSAAGIWGMGNLTDIVAGISLNPGEDTMVGVDFDIASRTTSNDNATVISNAYGNFFAPQTNFAGLTNQYNSVAGNANSNTSLGTVVTVYAKHNYGHGLSMMANVEFISLGNYYKPTTATTVGSSAYGLDLRATYSF